MSLELSSQIRLQDLRKSLEADYGEGACASIVVRNPAGEVVLFVSGESVEELADALDKYAKRRANLL